MRIVRSTHCLASRHSGGGGAFSERHDIRNRTPGNSMRDNALENPNRIV